MPKYKSNFSPCTLYGRIENYVKEEDKHKLRKVLGIQITNTRFIMLRGYYTKLYILAVAINMN